MKKIISLIMFSLALFVVFSISTPEVSASTQTDMYSMTEKSYKSTKTDAANGWKYFTEYNDKNSLNFKVFRKKNGTKYDYTFAYRGTKEGADILADLTDVILNMKSMQVGTAVTETQRIITLNKSTMNNVYFTGHSLGGFLAVWVGSEIIDGKMKNITKNKIKVYTFNAPGITPGIGKGVGSIEATKKILADKKYKYDKYIFNYRIKGDGISGWGDSLGVVKTYNIDLGYTKKDLYLTSLAHKLSNFKKVKAY